MLFNLSVYSVAVNSVKVSGKEGPYGVNSTCFQKGTSLAAVQKILGYNRLITMAIYLNLTDGHIVEGFEKKW